MQIANINGRLSTFVDGHIVDVETVSSGQFSSDVPAMYRRWDEFVVWGNAVGAHGAGDVPDALLNAPSPTPGQVFAIGVNYRDHAVEAKMPIPTHPVLFVKPRAALCGPYPQKISIPKLCQDGTSDYEAELTVVIGKTGRDIPKEKALEYVLGYTCGNDVSARTEQFRNTQWSFSKGDIYSLCSICQGPDERRIRLLCAHWAHDRRARADIRPTESEHQGHP